MRWPLFPIFACLTACSPSPDSIYVQVGGGLTYRQVTTQWRASRDGRLEVIQTMSASPFQTEKQQVKRSLISITSGQFNALRAVLEPVHRASTKPAHGACTLPDGPVIIVAYKGSEASWRWSSAEACQPANAAETYSAAQDATTMLRRWTEAKAK
jgi:hypothetical protein